MEKLKITGGQSLQGEISISGAKNAALPAIFACLLTEEKCVLDNIPALRDVDSALNVLRTMGVTCDYQDGKAHINAASLNTQQAPYHLVKTMRASVLALGPLLARFHQATVSLPGGCAIGARPVDMHIDGLQQMGATLKIEHGDIVSKTKNRLRAANIRLPQPTVTGTENLMMAASLADGETVIENAAQEPEIIDLAALLNKMGAKIRGAGDERIYIRGVNRLRGATHNIIPDRIETGTYLCAATAVGGDVFIRNARLNDLSAVVEKLRATGAQVQQEKSGIHLLMKNRPRAVSVKTAPHPGFPTDMQAQWMAVCAVADGAAEITENIFENRFMHVPELARMGADLLQHDGFVAVQGVQQLSGARVMATDLRASASLVIAALAAQGITTIERIYHLDRGYVRMDEKLQTLGAQIERIH